MTIAVLALQGAFAEHEKVLDRLGVSHIELRQASDLDQPFDALILPGGESTVQSKLLKELEMFEPLKKKNRKRNARPGYLRRTDPSGVGNRRTGQLSFRHHSHVRPQKCLWTTAGKLPYRRNG